MTTKKQIKLPEKLSGLISLAVKDCHRAQKSKRYKLDMKSLHVPNRPEEGKCSVCMAGAVLAFTLKVPSDREIHCWDDIPDGSRKFRAIDFAREGSLMMALDELGTSEAYLDDGQRAVLSKCSSRLRRLVRGRQRAAFSDYEKVAIELKAVGL